MEPTDGVRGLSAPGGPIQAATDREIGRTGADINADWRERRMQLAVLWLVAWGTACSFGFHELVYWDSAGYVQQAITGQIGGLGLGRPVFVLVSHGLAMVHRALGASPWELARFLQMFWLCVSAFSAPLTFLLARECGLARRAAFFAGLAVAVSPALAHANGAVLTDGPALATTCFGLLLALRALNPAHEVGHPLRWGVTGGVLLGLAFGLREQSVAQIAVYALALLVAPRPRRVPFAVGIVLGLACATIAPVVWAARTRPDYFAMVWGWVEAMRRERGQHAHGSGNLLAYGGWLFTLGPVAAPAAVVAWVRHFKDLVSPRRGLAFAVCLPALAQMALLAGYPDIGYSPRFLLQSLPGALAIPAGLLLDRIVRTSRRRAMMVLAVLVLPTAIAVPIVYARERSLVESLVSLPDDLRKLPGRSVVVTGQLCESIRLAQVIALREMLAWQGPRPEWQAVCPGWGWPVDLSERLAGERARGATVVLDLRPSSWRGADQRRDLAEVSRWERQHEGREGIVVWH
jgi:hypothetical protein